MADRNTYALLSARVYGASPDSNNVNKIFVPAGWTELPEFVDNGYTGLYARAYRNNATGEIVIAYRGTNTTLSDGTILDWQTNITAGLGIPNGQIAQAMSFYESIKSQYGSNVSFTGHSLGGGIASLMAVFFDKQATVFDEAPFQLTAINPITVVAYGVLAPSALLDWDFITYGAGVAFNGREENVTNYYLEGEIVNTIRSGVTTIVGEGKDRIFTLDQSTAGAIDRHDILVLTAAQYSGGFLKALQKLPHLLTQLLDTNLFAADRTSSDQDILSLLLRHQFGGPQGTITADKMLDGFARDLNQLIPGGLIKDAPKLDDALITTLMQGYDKLELDRKPFTTDFYHGIPGGFYFDINRIATSFNQIRTANDLVTALQTYYGLDTTIALNGFDRWYLQAGPASLIAEDTEGKKDLVAGGSNTDILQGGAGNDLLLGGLGTDIYKYRPNDGNDTIIDSDQKGIILYDPDGKAEGLAVGTRQAQSDGSYTGPWQSPDKTITYTLNGTDLTLTTPTGVITVQKFNQANNDLNIRLIDLAPEPPTDLPPSPARDTNDVQRNGTPQNDSFTGLPNTRVNGLTGDDDITGSGRLFGDEGSDLIRLNSNINSYADGGIGRDIVIGAGGNDHLIGGPEQDPTVNDDDALQGGDGDDYIEGGFGNDVLAGGNGKDILIGGDGHDILRGAATLTAANRSWSVNWPDPVGAIQFLQFTGNLFDSPDNAGDVMYGGKGLDELLGGQGDDLLYGEADNDSLHGNGGQDALFGGQGIDALEGGNGDDLLFGGSEKDYLFGDGFSSGGGQPGNDYLDGGMGDDELNGHGGDDVLYGSDGADTLFGDDGNDTLFGGTENDTLVGGPGADLLDGGPGVDTIYRDADDTVVFAPEDTVSYATGGTLLFDNVSFDQLTITAANGTDGWQYLILTSGANNFYMQGGFLGANQIFEIGGESVTQQQLMQYAPAVNLAGTTGNDTIYGGNKNDTLNGDAGTDTLVGQRGNDLLQGGAGDDAYVFNFSDGQDTIADAVGINRLRFGAGITTEDVYLDFDDYTQSPPNNNLVVRYSPTDQVTIGTYPLAASPILEFAAGTSYGYSFQAGGSGNDTLAGSAGADMLIAYAGSDILTGAAGNDSLIGREGNDTLTGGTGADLLAGGPGWDTYLFNLGDGQDWLRESHFGATGDYDVLRFGSGMALTDLVLSAANNDLVIAINGTTDRITVQDWFWPNALHKLDELQFAVGGSFNIGSRTDLMFTNAGTDGNDTLYADATNATTVLGLEGNDSLTGGDSNDTLDGGAGNDALNGRQGNDTYVFERGDGQDTIREVPGFLESWTNPGQDRVELRNLNASNVNFTRRGNDLVVGINGTADELTVQQWWYTDASRQIEKFSFADGTSLSSLDINRMALPVTGASINDSLYGGLGDNVISGLGGDDYLSGGPGNDTLSGDAGNDRLDGNLGDDRLEGGNDNDQIAGYEGNDTVIGGVGNDTLWGGVGSDTLDGGPGTDTLLGADAPYTGAGKTEINNNDTFLFGRGAGQDTVHAGPGDRIVFGAAVTAPDIALSRADYNLVLSISGTNDRLTLDGWFRGPGYRLDGFVFADGSSLPSAGAIYQGLLTYNGDALANTLLGNNDNETIRGLGGNDYIDGGAGNNALEGGDGDDRLFGGNWLDGGAGNDSLYGSANSRLDGGTGNDFLQSALNATYVFGRGYEQDTIRNTKISSSESSKDAFVDRVMVTTGTTAADIVLSRNGNDLVLGIAGTTDSLTVQSWFLSPDNRIDRFEFADATVLPSVQEITDSLLTEIPAAGSVIAGTAGVDNLVGTGASETLYGYAGDDALSGGGGADLLVGGADNDTYRFNRGDGQVAVYDYDWRDARPDLYGPTTDRVVFGTGISASDLSLSRSADDLVLRINGSSDQLTVRHWFAGPNYQVEFIFQDSSSLPTPSQIYINLLTLTGTTGSDLLKGYEGNNALAGLAGDDTLYGGTGGDALHGGDGADTLYGETGSDALYGENDGDLLYGYDGDDTLYGGSGSDSLSGGAGNDVLDGGPGADSYSGGEGNDTYVFNLGYGVDTISDSGLVSDINRVTFGSGISASSIAFSRSSNYLYLNITGTSDQLRIDRWFEDSKYQNFDFVFADGSRLPTPQEIYNSLLNQNGTAGTDTLRGYEGNDILRGLAGIDTLQGDTGNDVLYGGDGNDILVGDFTSGGTNDLLSHGDDRLYGDAGDDTLSGWAGDDILDGGVGNDSLAGGAGNDTYLFGLGYGTDDINDYDQYDAQPYQFGLSTDRVIFGTGISASNIDLQRSGNNLLLRVNGTSNQLTIQNWFLGDSYQVEDFVFADASRLPSADEIYQRMLTLTGTGGSDTLQGYEGAETFYGGVGNDWLSGGSGDDALHGESDADALYGQDGNDFLDGGTGSDQLSGGRGSDTYRFGRGYGQDIIYDYDSYDALPGIYGMATDRISMAAGLSISDIVFSRSANNLVLSIAGTGDAAVVDSWFVGSAYQLDQLTFADGSVFALDSFVFGTTGDDLSLGGTNVDDIVSGYAGNDTLNGLAGNDLLLGGPGADTMTGGPGNDTYLVDDTGDTITENLNEGTDAVQSSVAYTLTANLENLTLTGTATLTGTGNDLNNTITGNSADDFLNGGSGNDILNAGPGPTPGTVPGLGLGELTGGAGNDILIADTGANLLFGGEGDDVMTGGRGMSLLEGGPGNDTLTAGDLGSYLYGDTWQPSSVTGVSGNDTLIGGPEYDILVGDYGNDTLTGNRGDDTLDGGHGNDLYIYNRGDGQDTLIENDPAPGNTDTVRTDAIPQDLVLARSGANLQMRIHNSVDQLTITDWYQGSAYQTEVFQAGNNNTLLNTQVDLLIQAMAQFSASNGGITWDQAIDQRPQEAQAVLAAYWQSAGG